MSSPASGSPSRSRSSVFIVYGIFQYLATHPATSAQPNPMAADDSQIPPAPRIEEHPAIEIQQLHAQEDSTAFHLRLDRQEGGRGPHPHRSRHGTATAARVPHAKGGSQRNESTCLAVLLLLLRRDSHPRRSTRPPQTQVYAPSRLLQKVGINQKMGAQIPLDLPFADESGQDVTLRQYFGKPVILALVYYQCPSLCNMVLNGVLRSVKELDLTAGQANMRSSPSVSILARRRRWPPPRSKPISRTISGQALNRAGTSSPGRRRRARRWPTAVGFRYVYDAMTNQYAHSSAIMILTPAGRIARYFYGIEYPARDVRLGLVEASNERIGTPTDQVLLYCFHYDPTTGKYALVIMNVLRLAALITLGVLADVHDRDVPARFSRRALAERRPPDGRLLYLPGTRLDRRRRSRRALHVPAGSRRRDDGAHLFLRLLLRRQVPPQESG